MHPLLNDDGDIRVTQHAGRVTLKQLETIDQLLLILPSPTKSQVWQTFPGGTKLRVTQRKRPPKSIPAFVSRLDNKRQTRVVGGQLATSAGAFEQLTLARKLLSALSDEKPGTLGICVHGFANEDQADVALHALAAALAAAHRMPSYKQKNRPAPFRSIRLLGLSGKLPLERTIAEAHGNNLARWLTSMPPNMLDAESLADVARSLAKEHGWQFMRLKTKELQKLNAGAFLAVAQGNEDDSASIVRLRYQPDSKSKQVDLSLVGKGIIFDTGGTNLKPFKSMLDMHGDMQGSAVALGTLLAVSRLQLPITVDCWLALTENRTGPKAYKSQDVVTAANGKTIQTIHTDAEGRMALADTLVFASREQPQLIVDYATLTGSCVDAITTQYSGVFTNRAEWHPRLKRTGQRCGERVWPFPIGAEFRESLKSPVADLRQCTVNAHGDHILAATFLAEFVDDDSPWVHIDLSASEHEPGLAHIPTKVTGFGVRYTMSLILDEQLIETHSE